MSVPAASDLKAHGTTLAAAKGIAIASSLLTAGQFGTITSLLPSLYPAALTSHKLAAQQFAHQYRYLKRTASIAEIISGLLCGGLAYGGYLDNQSSRTWKLWAAAAGCMLSIPAWTSLLMEKPSTKLLWVSEVASSASTTKGPTSTGIGVKVTGATPPGTTAATSEAGASTLGLPNPGKGSGAKGGAITPMEEFEPFEDSPMDQQEYEQLKVIKLLKTWNGYNSTRVLLSFAAGVLSLWATLGE